MSPCGEEKWLLASVVTTPRIFLANLNKIWAEFLTLDTGCARTLINFTLNNKTA
jgi:hypothetical protein